MLAVLRRTVNVRAVVPPSPSAALGASIDSDGASSFVIVPVPVPVPITAFCAPDKRTTTVSSGSTVVSPRTDTDTDRLV